MTTSAHHHQPEPSAAPGALGFWLSLMLLAIDVFGAPTGAWFARTLHQLEREIERALAREAFCYAKPPRACSYPASTPGGFRVRRFRLRNALKAGGVRGKKSSGLRARIAHLLAVAGDPMRAIARIAKLLARGFKDAIVAVAPPALRLNASAARLMPALADSS